MHKTKKEHITLLNRCSKRPPAEHPHSNWNCLLTLFTISGVTELISSVTLPFKQLNRIDKFCIVYNSHFFMRKSSIARESDDRARATRLSIDLKLSGWGSLEHWSRMVAVLHLTGIATYSLELVSLLSMKNGPLTWSLIILD